MNTLVLTSLTGGNYIAIIAAIIAVVLITFMLIKKIDARLALFANGLFLLVVSALLGNLSAMEGGTGIALLNPFLIIGDTFVNYIKGAGIIIMLLFGYSMYMSKIGANDVTVDLLTKPLLKIKSPYVLVVLMFLVGNLLAIVVPSASSLAIILMATLYPVLRKSGMTALTAAAVIATSATIMPTPLGSDNIAIAKELGLDIMTYTFAKHALVSIPGILVFACSHFFWQKFMDKRAAKNNEINQVDVDVSQLKSISKELPPKIYVILPLLPIILLLMAFIAQKAFNLEINLSVSVVTLFSLMVAICFEACRKSKRPVVANEIGEFFNGMGTGFTQVVTIVVGATIFVEGLKSLGIISLLTNAATQFEGAGIVVMLVFVAFILLIGLLSGSGNSALFALIALVPSLADAAGVPGHMITVPMQMASNLVRGLTPLAAVIVIVAAMIKENPMNVVKRTFVPSFVTMVFTMILSVVLFYFLGM